MENNTWYFALGFMAQLLFGLRMLIQWIMSEKEKKVVSPTIYWQISLLASFLFSLYGWLRGDFAIILGQIFSYYIYIWNLNNKKQWTNVHPLIRYIVLLTPIVALGFVIYNGDYSYKHLFGSVPFWLILFGSAGQIIFTSRFIYQWLYSRSRGESLLPPTFWILSLVGSGITIAYAIFRKDPVLIISQLGGFITYSRNLWLGRSKAAASDT